ncbi:immunogenic protein MPT63 [Mycolicibacterium grossiae]|uniref:Immunogenic protein MPT63 n=1 Tax=Mycolicibacterium grossiae TaxID=1552759 RepID=A0A1E8PXY5_9MYCO|nr:MPT63 family protein [Mycolicibacterium grossiae]OFJ51178.1 immunogenic protein MPT63 [Mycolicibacterium grossiae]
MEREYAVRRSGLTAVLMALAALVGVGFAGVASAAEDCMHLFGSHQQVADAGGVQDWSVTDLKKSSDPAPGYPLAGQLWEATVSVTAISGTVTPIIPNFSASTRGGADYRVLWQLASSQGISPAPLPQGQTATGKIYFDVTGAAPMGVTYEGGDAKPLMWCCDEAMMAKPMNDCPCCAGQASCPCCVGMM